MEIAGADGSSRTFNRLDLLGSYVDRSILILHEAGDLSKSGARNAGAFPLQYIRGDDDIGKAGSSFSGRKTNTLAVPGRWRAMTHPAMLALL
jgi:hypothetical protein